VSWALVDVWENPGIEMAKKYNSMPVAEICLRIGLLRG